MRFLISLSLLITYLGSTSCHRSGVHFGRSGASPRFGAFGAQQGAFGSQPQNSGNVQPQVLTATTPTGSRGCFCLPANQLCDPTGVVPRAATKITNIRTRIVNVNLNNCPQGQNECCFGSFVGDGNIIPPITSPIAGCGFRNSLFPGRSNTDDADFGEYPWMTAILAPNNNFVAGGVLIDPNWVLTAAHKVVKEEGVLTVRVGDYDLASANEVPQFPHQEIIVNQVILHPKFNPSNLFNDIALLRLSKPAKISQHIQTSCLPEKFQKFSGQRCFVSGWGQNLDGNFQAVLKEVDLPIVDKFECEQQLRNTRLGNSFSLNQDSFLCAGGEAGKDACGGDGGSPLVCNENGLFTVVGLVAWGIGCGQNQVPGVYVDVASFSDYIQNTLYGSG